MSLQKPIEVDQQIITRAHPNIALIKYWGKTPNHQGFPAVPSLSVTLDTLVSEIRLTRRHAWQEDVIFFNKEKPAALFAQKIKDFLNLVRKQAGEDFYVEVHAFNNFPTAAGLASSASGFAALALAASHVYGLSLQQEAVSALARMGSASAARSILGGFAMITPERLHKAAIEGAGALYAESLVDPKHMPLAVVVAITAFLEKKLSSRDGMVHTQNSSPFYAAWLQHAEADFYIAKEAILQKNFQGLAKISVHSAFKMHATMLAADPPLCYWQPATLAALQTVAKLQEEGIAVFATMDAGPQVKAVCLPEAVGRVEQALQKTPGVLQVLTTTLGPGAFLVS